MTPILKPGEVYCTICEKVIKRKNLDRHDNSVSHEKKIEKKVNKILKKDEH